MAPPNEPLPERDSSEDLTQTGIRAPTRVSLPPPAPAPPLELPFADVRPEAEPDPWRDELPTLVFEKPFRLERPAPAPDDALSVVFRGAHPATTRAATATRPSTLPPERRTVQPLLPPPDDVVIPPAPRTPSEFSGSRYPRVPLPSAPPPSTDSMRPLAIDARSFPPLGPVARMKPLHLLSAAIVGGGVLLGSFAWWQEQHGELVIDIADQQCGSVDNVQVYVDDELRCTSAPCTLTVRTGGHLVRAEVDGQTDAAARAVFVSPDIPALHKIQMGSNDKTAIEVRGGRGDSELFIDGRPEGALPKRVTGLSSGAHLVQLHDQSGATVLERRVYLEDDQLMVLDLTLPPEAPAAPESPKDLPLASSRTSAGDRSESRDGTRSDAKSGNESSRASSDSAGSSDSAAAVEKAADSSRQSPATGSAGKRTPQATAKATLRLTAEPSAMVLIDGRPLGHTPQRVQVDPGAHALLFVHPVHGRSRASVTVKAGQTRNLHARF